MNETLRFHVLKLHVSTKKPHFFAGFIELRLYMIHFDLLQVFPHKISTPIRIAEWMLTLPGLSECDKQLWNCS